MGSLFAGYGGIELALSSVLDVRPAWFVEFDKAPSKVLAHHWPDVPNHGDVTKIDWTTVEPVDIITGGSPCQDLSHAGKRAGMTEGTRSNLWVQMREAINVIRPRLVVWENVRGAFSAPADSALEPCPGCVGDGDDGPVLRALGRVLGDLADLGYDCSLVWHSRCRRGRSARTVPRLPLCHSCCRRRAQRTGWAGIFPAPGSGRASYYYRALQRC
jgi:DNA (cytosine-5)-methyltransferase 1